MKISLEERRQDKHKGELYERLRRVIAHIHDRCNNPNFKQYSNYGGAGVTYTPDWESTEGFVNDVDSIEGWNEKEFLARNLELDKDIKIKGNKLYSKDTCKWVTHQENMKNMRTYTERLIYGYHQYTGELVSAYNKLDLVEKYPEVNRNTIFEVLRGRKHRTGNWYLWYADSKAPIVTYYYAENIYTGEVFGEINPKRLAESLGFPNKLGLYMNKDKLYNKVYKIYSKEFDLGKL